MDGNWKHINLIDYIVGLGYTPAYRWGDKAMFLSPLRDEKHPSFYVSWYKDKWWWRDFGTNEGGDVISFIEKYYGVDFKGAIKILTGDGVIPPQKNSHTDTNLKEPSLLWKVKLVREFYKKTLSTTAPKSVEKYFLDKGVKYHPEMGCSIFTSFKEGKRYICIPTPYPQKVRGLELREIGGSSRKTYGVKTLWAMRRDTSKMLITESVLDALAGECLLNKGDITLVSLNGVGNVKQLATLFDIYRPSEVFFALDKDEPGQKAQEEGIALVPHGTKVEVLEIIGGKDLYRMLTTRLAEVGGVIK